MDEKSVFPKIEPVFESLRALDRHLLFCGYIQNILRKILPESFFTFDLQDGEKLAELSEQFHNDLPLMSAFPCPILCDDVPCDLSFFVLGNYRSDSYKFFFEMISKWLVPGKRLNVTMLFTFDFRMPDLSRDVYTISEVALRVEEKQDLEQLQRNLPMIETEVKLGCTSSYYARRIMEIKGQGTDEKTMLIHEEVAHLMKRWPKNFDHDVISELQHVLVLCSEQFKKERNCRHFSRIISFHHLFRKMLLEAMKKDSNKRHLFLKLFRAKVHLQTQRKEVLSVVVGLNFLRDKEVFDKKHVLMAIQHYIPKSIVVEGSFFVNRRGSENLLMLYLEMEKSDGALFSPEEIQILRSVLSDDLKGRIEHLLYPVFMPCNEEEVMRNILSLSNQIKFLRDIPQVFISFDEQSPMDLFFTVILLRVRKPGTLSIEEMFRMSSTYLQYIHDRCKTVGYLRKRYTKEATVFRVQFSKDQFLRKDHSIDLYKARQAVVNELTAVVGEFRDFNGGMISKQNELLNTLRVSLEGGERYDDLLLENFFFSLTPVIMRTVVNPQALKTLFTMLLRSKLSRKDEPCSLEIRAEPNYVFLMIGAQEEAIKEEIHSSLSKFYLHSTELAQTFVTVSDQCYIGYLYKSDDPHKQREFCQTIQQTIAQWSEERETQCV